MAPKRQMKLEVERWLKDGGVPYISVNEARKVLFTGGKLLAFHFVVYRNGGSNLLVWAAQLRKECVGVMREWESVFGPGFEAVYAKVKPDGGVVFKTFAGREARLVQVRK